MTIDWTRIWQTRSGLSRWLYPLSWLYIFANRLHRLVYALGLKKRYHSSIPVLVVGNIQVGGAGKTPLVIALGKWLMENDIPVAVISRGYGGDYQSAHQAWVVQATDRADWVGDEAWLIRHHLQCPVIVGKTRQAAIELAKQQFKDMAVFLSDDGLQHYQLHPDITVCVVPYPHTFGNGWRLPAGPLRESPNRLDDFDFVVHNGNTSAPYHYMLGEKGWFHIHSNDTCFIDEFSNDKAQNLAIAGIANPNRFFATLAAQGICAETLALPDHVDYRQVTLPKDKTLLMTEKDWTKLRDFDLSDAWYLAMQAVLSEPFKNDVLAAVQAKIQEKNKGTIQGNKSP